VYAPIDDDNAESKLSKLGPLEPPTKPELVVDEELYQSGCGAGAPIDVSYFFAHSAATPAATANGTYAL
jgi:hypothetical protein